MGLYYIQLGPHKLFIIRSTCKRVSPVQGILMYRDLDQDFDTCSVHYRASVCSSGVSNFTFFFFLQQGLHTWLWWCRYAGMLAAGLVYVWEWLNHCDRAKRNSQVLSEIQSPRMSSSWVLSASLLSSSEGHLGPLLASVVILLLLPVPHVIAGHVPLVK